MSGAVDIIYTIYTKHLGADQQHLSVDSSIKQQQQKYTFFSNIEPHLTTQMAFYCQKQRPCTVCGHGEPPRAQSHRWVTGGSQWPLSPSLRSHTATRPYSGEFWGGRRGHSFIPHLVGRELSPWPLRTPRGGSRRIFERRTGSPTLSFTPPLSLSLSFSLLLLYVCPLSSV